MGRVWAVPRLCEVYPGICLTTVEKAGKNLSQGSRRMHEEGYSIFSKFWERAIKMKSISDQTQFNSIKIEFICVWRDTDSIFELYFILNLLF